MSQENVELVRRCLWALENDTDTFRDTLHPEIEWFPFEENQRRLYGVEAAMRNRNEWLDTWDEHRIDLEEVIEQGDSVVASIHMTARGKASGVTTDVRFYPHAKIRDHRIVYIFDHRDRRQPSKPWAWRSRRCRRRTGEIVGRVLRRYSERDIDGMLADVHSDVEIDYSESNAPDASVYHGHAACRSFVLGRYEDFEERSFDAVELIDAPPNTVVAVGRMRGRGRASEVAVEADSVTLWTLRDRKISQIKLYQTRAEALKAVGLSG